MGSKRNCPECHLIFEAELPETGGLVCPLCNSVFSALPPADTTPEATFSPSNASGRQVWRGVLAVSVLFLVGGGIGYAYHLLSDIDHKTAAAPVAVPHAPPEPERSPPIEIIPTIPVEPIPQATVPPTKLASSAPQTRYLPIPKDAIANVPARPLTMLEERVNRAIDRGLAYLRKNHSEQPQYRSYLGLLGLTLLECGVAAGDPSVQQIATWIRAEQRGITQTYEIALALLFLDRLGDPRDLALIGNFGQRLLFGQLFCGAWTYSCLMNNAGRIEYRGDNSNTQFALLGLWVARRHGVQADSALLAAEQHFRSTQLRDGSWIYGGKGRYSRRDSMTCAGLMSLALRYGVSGIRTRQGRGIHPDRAISVHDAAILQGLHYLAQSLKKITIADNRIMGVEAADPLYFLWSLERMAVIYDLKKIGEREWYPWAAQMLVETQRPDGCWLGYIDPVGTCFALLVLTRSNFVKDFQLAVQEPPSRSMSAVSEPKNVQYPDVSGPTILQGMDAFLGRTRKSRRPASMPPGPSITKTPNAK